MRTLIKCELLKTRRRYVLLTALALSAAMLGWTFHGKYTEDMIRWGWMAFLYQLPLANAIFLPLLAMVVSSRLCDIEHKGVMLKSLVPVADKGKIFDAKLIYGMAIMLLCVILCWVITILWGRYKGFGGALPVKLYLLYLLFTVIPTVELYIFQHILSLCFKNQAVAFFTGIIGSFCGLFSMFLPQFPWLRKLLFWGHYGALQFVGLFGWTQETKYSNAYYAVMEIDWVFFGAATVACIVLYIIGRAIFVREEL